MMSGMETRNEKDAKTIAIARAVAIFVIVLAAAVGGAFLASLLGVTVTDTWLRVAVAVAALLSVTFLLRRRD